MYQLMVLTNSVWVEKETIKGKSRRSVIKLLKDKFPKVDYLIDSNGGKIASGCWKVIKSN